MVPGRRGCRSAKPVVGGRGLCSPWWIGLDAWEIVQIEYEEEEYY